jgi:opacity protein-like surface antigen
MSARNRQHLWVMKAFTIGGFLCVAAVSLCAAPPQFYAIGQVLIYNADAGDTARFGPYVGSITSGNKAGLDLGIGADLLDWLSVEAGYVDLGSFTTKAFVLNRYVSTFRPEAVYHTYELRGYRLTPVLHIRLNDHFRINLLGGFTHSDGNVVVRDYTDPAYRTMVGMSNDSYHLGAGLTWRLSGRWALEARYTLYDFGKVYPDTDRVTANALSAGISFCF